MQGDKFSLILYDFFPIMGFGVWTHYREGCVAGCLKMYGLSRASGSTFRENGGWKRSAFCGL